MPPRHGKSELASRRFPAWCLGRTPELQFISASATAELASDFGRDVRNIITSRDYQSVFGRTLLASDSGAKGKWHTSEGGVYYSVGIGGTIMGRGADIFLIDDPYASMADAQSAVTRKKVYEWYTGTAYNRLEGDAAIVLINHRMHEEDLTGQLLAQQAAGGDQWEVVELPAISEDGAALWDCKFPLKALERIKRNTLPHFWSALYQQKPTPEDGDYFKRNWFRWYNADEKPRHLRLYGASDYAVTANGGDYTVHVVCGLDPDDNLYVIDLWRAQTESHDWVEAFLDLMSEHKTLDWAEEQGQILKSLGPFIKRRMRERKVYGKRTQFPSSGAGDKAVRCRSFQARCSMGKVYLPTNAPWIPDFLQELLAFGAGGKHDDQVDAVGLIGRMLDTMHSSKPKGETKRHEDSWDRAFKRQERDSSNGWKTV